MILCSERYNYLGVFHCSFNPTLSATRIGDMELSDGTWRMSFMGRNWNHFSDLLDHSEKRQIIGMLDKLNHVIGRDQGDSLRRWQEIIGRIPGIGELNPIIGPLSHDGIEGLDDNNPWGGKF